MKKLLLFLSLMLVSITAFARDFSAGPPPGQQMGTCVCKAKLAAGVSSIPVQWDMMSIEEQCTPDMCEKKAQLFAKKVMKPKAKERKQYKPVFKRG